MQALEFDGRTIRLKGDVPRPVPGDDEILVRVMLAGICGTDLELAKGYMGFEGIPGHEFVGRVAVDPIGELTERRIVSEINCACGSCDTCRRGIPGHCPNRTVIGIDGRDGAFAEYIAVPRKNLHLLPDGISDPEGVLVEPFAAAMKGVEDAGIEPGDSLAVLGDGPLGLMTAMFAGLLGTPTTLIGKHPSKMDRLAGSGVRTMNLDEVPSGTMRSAFERVIDCTGSPEGLPLALDLVRPLGRIVMKTTVAGGAEMVLAPLVIDEVELRGSRCGSFSRAIAALEREEIPLRELITSIHDLDRWGDAFSEASGSESLKVLLRIGD